MTIKYVKNTIKVPTGYGARTLTANPVSTMSQSLHKRLQWLLGTERSEDLDNHFKSTFRASEETTSRMLQRLLVPDTQSVRQMYKVDDVVNAQVSVIVGSMSRDVSPAHEPWILIEKRSPDTAFPDDLCLAGGLVKAAEMADPRNAILREIEEESALMVDGMSISGVLRNTMMKQTGKDGRTKLLNVVPVVAFCRRPFDAYDFKPQHKEVQRLMAVNFRSMVLNGRHYTDPAAMMSTPAIRDALPKAIGDRWGEQAAITLSETPGDYPYRNSIGLSQPKADDPVQMLDPYVLRMASLTDPSRPPEEQDLLYGLTGAIMNRLVELLAARQKGRYS